jgi:hypothetical protein
MEWFNEWWTALTLTEQILHCIAIPSSLFLAVQAILIVVGAGGDMDTDTSGGDLDGGGLDNDFDGTVSGDFGVMSLFTIQGVASFFCVFGWSSIFIYSSGLSLVFALLIAFVLGVAVMYAIARLMYYLARLAHSGTLDVKNLLGSMGTVYLNIPPKGEGKGKVTIQTSERLVEFEAVSENDAAILNNTQIRVIDILGENVLVVEAC